MYYNYREGVKLIRSPECNFLEVFYRKPQGLTWKHSYADPNG